MSKHKVQLITILLLLLLVVLPVGAAGADFSSTVEVIADDTLNYSDGFVDITWSWFKNDDSVKYYKFRVNDEHWTVVGKCVHEITTLHLDPNEDNCILVSASNDGRVWSPLTKQTLHKMHEFEPYGIWAMTIEENGQSIVYVSDDTVHWMLLSDLQEIERQHEAEAYARMLAELEARENAERIVRTEAERNARLAADKVVRANAVRRAVIAKETARIRTWDSVHPFEIQLHMTTYPYKHIDFNETNKSEISSEDMRVGTGLGLYYNLNKNLSVGADGIISWEVYPNIFDDADVKVDAGFRLRLFRLDLLRTFVSAKFGYDFVKLNNGNFAHYPMFSSGLKFRIDAVTGSMLDFGCDAEFTFLEDQTVLRVVPYFSVTYGIGEPRLQ